MSENETIEAELVKKDIENAKEPHQIAVPQAASLTPGQMLSTLVQQGADPEILEKFMALQERWEDNEAKKAYELAVSKFKKNPPEVSKDKVNTQYDSRYTSKGNLINTVNAGLSKCGLSARFDYEQKPELITVTCILTHSQGHSESVSLSAPPDKSGAKNTIQQIKSTITYLEIVTYSGVTGTSSIESVDDDGNAAGNGETVDRVSVDQVKTIKKLISDNKLDLKAFLKFIKKETVESIAALSFDWCVEQIEFVAKKRQDKAGK